MLHGYDVPIQNAASLSGFEPSAFITLLYRGDLGPKPSEPNLMKAPLLQVVTAVALSEADKAGISREKFGAVRAEVADAVYVWLARLEFSRRRIHPATWGTMYAQKLNSSEGHGEFERLLGVSTRDTKQYAIFAPDGTMLVDSLPDTQGCGCPFPYLNARRIAEQIQNRTTDILFH